MRCLECGKIYEIFEEVFMMRVFGPVPSRRLGRSLGINNIPHKICTYSCVYCQIGKAIKMQDVRQEFYKPDELVDEAKKILCNIHTHLEYPNYLTIVPDGEPTLDIHLGELIDKLKITNIPVAVITNASLINIPKVQSDLSKADYVSLKIDTLNFETFHKVNKPFKGLNLNKITDGITLFAKKFSGKLVTETMLLKGMNDSYNEIEEVASFLEIIRPDIAYIAIPTRPPAFSYAKAVDEEKINEAYFILKKRLPVVELLTGYEGNAFSSTGNVQDDILSITSVHPMREDAVKQLLQKSGEQMDVIDKLIDLKLITRINYQGKDYYLRNFSK